MYIESTISGRCFLVDDRAMTSLWPQHKASHRDHSVKVRFAEGVRHDVGRWYHLQERRIAVGRPPAPGLKAEWRVAAMRRSSRPDLENRS